MDTLEALAVLGINKLGLMKMVYGPEMQGIDSAIPQGYVDAHLEGKNLFEYVTDCRTNNYRVVNLIEELGEEKRAVIICRALLFKAICNSGELNISDARPVYDFLAKIAEGAPYA
jgi:hypothetical protein